MDDRDLYSGLIRLHILHHAEKESIFGLGMIEELARHGYRLSAGTLYPILHGLEERGYLSSIEQRTGSATRRIYRAPLAEALGYDGLWINEEHFGQGSRVCLSPILLATALAMRTRRIRIGFSVL